MTSIIDKPLTRSRLSALRGGKPSVDRTGGIYGAGKITAVSVITVGEALGHGQWIDGETVDQVVSFGSRSSKGIKSRFTHPGLSADGMGTVLGRLNNFRRDGERALADLHFFRAAHRTPDGDLATYVMDLAEEDPEAFGTSIVFEHDYGAENRFRAEHDDEDGNFRSPDKKNTNNFRHIRLAKLWAGDVVDEPAANPGGLFRQGHEIAEEADKLCQYALGLSAEKPTLTHLSADAERFASFAARFLESHQLELKHKEPVMTEEQKISAAVKESTDKLNADHQAAIEKLQSEHVAQLAAAKEGQKPDPNKEAVLNERTRVQELTQLASNAGIKDPKVLNRWIETDVSLTAAKCEVADIAIQQGKLSKDDSTPDTGDKATQAKAKATAEYQEHAKLHASLGYTEDKWVERRAKEIEAELAAAK